MHAGSHRLSEGFTGRYAAAGVLDRAIQILHWDQTHRFCGRCGEPTVHAPTERAKLCPKCGLLSFPRLSPAVIMLVQRGRDEFLLARNPNFPEDTGFALKRWVKA